MKDPQSNGFSYEVIDDCWGSDFWKAPSIDVFTDFPHRSGSTRIKAVLLVAPTGPMLAPGARIGSTGYD